MGVLKIGINGFGRIGRLVFRQALDRSDIEVVAINDLLEVEHLAYLLTHDSVHGKLKASVIVQDGNLVVNDKIIRVTAIKDPEKLQWDAVGAAIVAECTGIFKSLETANLHIKAGAKKVVVSAPSKDIPMFVMGVNHMDITPEHTILSNASCTTNCLAPIANILENTFGIEEALMTTIHAVTATQNTVDGPSKKNYRLGRGALQNIIPTTTGAAKAVAKVIPALQQKITGMAFRVPVADVSVVDLTVKLKTPTSYEAIKKAIQIQSQTTLKGIIAYTQDPVVSQDFVGDTHISIFDASAGIALNDTFFKLVCWYDNETGYAAKLLDLALHTAMVSKIE